MAQEGQTQLQEAVARSQMEHSAELLSARAEITALQKSVLTAPVLHLSALCHRMLPSVRPHPGHTLYQGLPPGFGVRC